MNTIKKKKADVSKKDCVACGSCVSVCPRDAISIYKGVHAFIDRNLCVGCSKCKKICPASIIEMEVVV